MNRIEHDGLGEKQIPNDLYYGVQTIRAIENFYITGTKMSERPKIIRALAAVKQAAAIANMELGLLAKNLGEAIVSACQEVISGKFYDQFPVDMVQGGAGTSANMNANEVICNRALELLGHKKGEYQFLHPLNHVNLSQSTNDVYPTAAKIAIAWMSGDIIEGIVALREAFFAKGKEFKNILKMGRTQLQDAVPMTMGQEFRAFGIAIGEDIGHLQEALKLSYIINMGATAIGTGINTFPGYAESVCKNLSTITNLPLTVAPDLVHSTSDTGVFVAISSVLKSIAVKLTKICNDLRLLSSGPKTGFHDINLPAMQPGSSIMPGKVNPVIPEAVNQVCFQVIGYDLAITMAASAGQLQLNAFEPLIVYDIFEAITLLRRAFFTLKEKCVDGITANDKHCEEEVWHSPGLITAFTPYIGYEKAAEIAKKSQETNKTVYELVKEDGLLSEEDIQQILSPEQMTHPTKKLDVRK